MKKNFIITVTNNIEGCTIERYISTICSNIVIGTNIFSDISASITDFFGGMSATYKRKLELIYNSAKKELYEKAQSLGANAIIGFKMDFDEVSGKSKSMFMVSVSGTACYVNYKDKIMNVKVEKDSVSKEILYKEMKRRAIISEINKTSEIRSSFKDFLLENPQVEILDSIINYYIRNYISNEIENSTLEFIEKYIPLLPKEIVTSKVYGYYEENKNAIKNLIKKCNLFSPNEIYKLCKDNYHLALDLLTTDKELYLMEDINKMEDIYKTFTSLPDIGKIENVKSGILGKDRNMYICPNGHKNPENCEYCEKCFLDKKGLTYKDKVNIDKFKQKIDVLKDLMNQA